MLFAHLNNNRKIVLFPLPLAPTTAQLVPAGTLKDTPLRMLESGRYLHHIHAAYFTTIDPCSQGFGMTTVLWCPSTWVLTA